MVLLSVFLHESMLCCRVSQQLRAQLLLIFCCLAAEHATGRCSCPFDTCNLWQRIRELGADPDLLGYVWDGGSSHEYVQPDKIAGSGLSQPDGQLALTTLPHNRLAASASDSPSARFALWFGVFVVDGGGGAAAAAAAVAASGRANKLACLRMQHGVRSAIFTWLVRLRQGAQGLAGHEAHRRRIAHARGGNLLGHKTQVPPRPQLLFI